MHKSGAGVSETFFLDSGDDEIAEYDGSGTLLRRYVPGPSIDRPVAMVDVSGSSTVLSFFHTDERGSVIAMGDASGNRVEGPYTYDPYGNGAPASGVPYKYTGRRLDAETGLYYYRARMYSPALGRFLQTDPIGYGDQINLYAYVGNDPTNQADPTGKDAEGALIGAAWGADIGEGLGVLAGLGCGPGAPACEFGTISAGAAAGAATGALVGDKLTGPNVVQNKADDNKAGAANDGSAKGQQEREANRAKGIPDSKLGPSGKPKSHEVQHNTKKGAREAAERQGRQQGGSARHDTTSTTGQPPHYQGENASGENVKPVVHQCYPPGRC